MPLHYTRSVRAYKQSPATRNAQLTNGSNALLEEGMFVDNVPLHFDYQGYGSVPTIQRLWTTEMNHISRSLPEVKGLVEDHECSMKIYLLHPNKKRMSLVNNHICKLCRH